MGFAKKNEKIEVLGAGLDGWVGCWVVGWLGSVVRWFGVGSGVVLCWVVVLGVGWLGSFQLFVFEKKFLFSVVPHFRMK